MKNEERETKQELTALPLRAIYAAMRNRVQKSTMCLTGSSGWVRFDSSYLLADNLHYVNYVILRARCDLPGSSPMMVLVTRPCVSLSEQD